MEKSTFFRQISVLLSHSVENYYKMRSRFLRKNWHFFRQINVFTEEVTKELISRNFLRVIAFYRTFPHCVHAAQCRNYRNSLSCIFGKNLVQVTVLLIKSLKSWFDEKNFDESKFFIFPQCMYIHLWKNENFSLTKKIIRQINSLATIYLAKPLLSRDYCQKCVSEFL